MTKFTAQTVYLATPFLNFTVKSGYYSKKIKHINKTDPLEVEYTETESSCMLHIPRVYIVLLQGKISKLSSRRE